jgi:hypothetical protein
MILYVSVGLATYSDKVTERRKYVIVAATHYPNQGYKNPSKLTNSKRLMSGTFEAKYLPNTDHNVGMI